MATKKKKARLVKLARLSRPGTNWTMKDGKSNLLYTNWQSNILPSKRLPPVTTQYSFHEVGQVNIVFPQGVMEKVIEVNQSQTADGITLTLQRVELLADRMKIYVLKTPGYTPSQPGKPEPPSLAGKADITGTYSVDDGDTLGLGSFGYRPVDDWGVEYIWESLYQCLPMHIHYRSELRGLQHLQEVQSLIMMAPGNLKYNFNSFPC